MKPATPSDDSSTAAASITTRLAAATNMTPLTPDFEPGPDDVVCGRGKKCYNHIGNDRFRQRVLTFLDEYSRAKSKLDKSTVLTKVVQEVRLNSPHGGFVKQDGAGRWHEVGDFLAREKTSQCFRDALHDRYKSSSVSKKRRRQEEQVKASSNYNRIMRSEYEISSRLERLSNEVAVGAHDDPLQSIDSFNRANYEMLSRMHRVPLSSARGRQRYSPSPKTSYRPLMQQEEPSAGGGGAHFPDPLFGPTMNDANRMPSEYARDRLSARGERDLNRLRQYQEAGASESFRGGLNPQRSDDSMFHRSLPEEFLMFREGSDPFDIDDSIRSDSINHHSMPELGSSLHRMEQEQDQDQKPPARDMEPIPYRNIKIPDRPKSMHDDVVKKPSAAVPAPDVAAPAAAAPAAASGYAAPVPAPMDSDSMHIPASSIRTVRLSKDLIECLDKMTYHSIAEEENPFEPIPLTPQQEQDLAAKIKREAVITNLPAVDPLMEEDPTDHDEFAEG